MWISCCSVKSNTTGGGVAIKGKLGERWNRLHMCFLTQAGQFHLGEMGPFAHTFQMPLNPARADCSRGMSPVTLWPPCSLLVSHPAVCSSVLPCRLTPVTNSGPCNQQTLHPFQISFSNTPFSNPPHLVPPFFMSISSMMTLGCHGDLTLLTLFISHFLPAPV